MVGGMIRAGYMVQAAVSHSIRDLVVRDNTTTILRGDLQELGNSIVVQPEPTKTQGRDEQPSMGTCPGGWADEGCYLEPFGTSQGQPAIKPWQGSAEFLQQRPKIVLAENHYESA